MSKVNKLNLQVIVTESRIIDMASKKKQETVVNVEHYKIADIDIVREALNCIFNKPTSIILLTPTVTKVDNDYYLTKLGLKVRTSWIPAAYTYKSAKKNLDLDEVRKRAVKLVDKAMYSTFMSAISPYFN